MLADIDDPPRSRTRDLILGLAVALPVIGLVFGWLIPAFVGTILGGAAALDDSLRGQETYMQQVCGAPELPRDEALCGCVFSTEFPGLDCQDRFRPWLAARAVDTCADETVASGATSFCVCAQVVREDLNAAEESNDEVATRQASQGMDRCLALPDALALEAIYAPGPSA